MVGRVYLCTGVNEVKAFGFELLWIVEEHCEMRGNFGRWLYREILGFYRRRRRHDERDQLHCITINFNQPRTKTGRPTYMYE